MKKILFISLLFVFTACENAYEDSLKYMKPYYLSKNYPIFFDASEILVDIQVKSPVNPDAAFKIISNDKYFFVGEKMKGIHVFEKKDTCRAIPLCFIDCKFIKAFDVKDNLLYCNNFVDLLVIDVENPLQAKIKHRESAYFNNYSGYYQNFLSYGTNNIFEIGFKQIVLQGIETESSPAPNFEEYDKLYGNIIVKEIPDTLQGNKPYAGIANIDGKIFTLGQNTIVQCSYASEVFEIILRKINFSQYAYIPLCDLKYKDGMIYILGENRFEYLDYAGGSIQSQSCYYWDKPLLDVVKLKNQENIYIVLSDNSIAWVYAGTGGVINSTPSLAATSLVNINDTILALGKELTLYCFRSRNSEPLELVKQYSGISGSCMLKEDNVLIVANKQEVLFYDVSDLKNITLIP